MKASLVANRSTFRPPLHMQLRQRPQIRAHFVHHESKEITAFSESDEWMPDELQSTFQDIFQFRPIEVCAIQIQLVTLSN